MKAQLIALVVAVSCFASLTHAEDKQAPTSSRTAWRGVFAGSTVVVLTGIGLWMYGGHQIDDAEQQLCTGDYETSCGHPPPSDANEVRRLNDQGFRGVNLQRYSGVVTLSFGVVAGFALYKGFIAKDEPPSRVTIVPTVTPNSAGAAMTLTF